MPHMKQLHATYAPQGVVFLGISRDDSARTVRKFVQRRELPWPQVLDKQQQPQLSALFGTRGIPHAFIISPEGRVLWRGHPGAIDRPLADALKQHPPGKTGEIDDAIGDTETSEDEEARPAISSAEKQELAARRDAERAEALRQEKERRAANLLVLADRKREAGRHASAYASYLKILDRYESSEVATEADSRCEEYEADDVFMENYEKTVAETKSKSTLSLAEAYRKRGKLTMAQLHYQEITQRYPGTDAAVLAAAGMRDLQEQEDL
jgi:hypothetical protein